MINDFNLNRQGIETSLFADDGALYKSGNNINLIMKDLQEGLNDVKIWADQWGMKFSAQKSCGVIFTHNLRYKIEQPLKLGEHLEWKIKLNI